MILDLSIFLLLLISIIIGAKVGFLQYILKIASLFTGFIIAVFLTSPVTKLIMKTSIGDNVQDNIKNNIFTSDIYTSGNLSSNASIVELLEEIGVPKFLSSILSGLIDNIGTSEEIINSIAHNVGTLIVGIVTFFVLLIAGALVIFILKLFAKLLRQVTVIRFIDSTVGIIFSFGVFTFVIYLLLAITYGLLNFSFIENAIGDFIYTQLDSSIGILDFFYKENIIVNLFETLF